MKYVAIAFTILITSCATQPRHDKPAPVDDTPVTKSGEPGQITAPELIELDHKYFKIHYDPAIRLARFVVYTATKEELCKTGGDRDKSKFHPDAKLVEQNIPFVDPKEYKKHNKERATKYDQGHLAPAGDFTRSQEATDATFTMANMAPQRPKLNQTAWRIMEGKVKAWGIHEGKITVITGPIIEDGMKKLVGGLAIPARFFKIIVDETAPRKAIGFIYKQSDEKGNVLPNRVAKVSEIQSAIKRDFDLNVPDSKLEDWTEGSCVR